MAGLEIRQDDGYGVIANDQAVGQRSPAVPVPCVDPHVLVICLLHDLLVRKSFTTYNLLATGSGRTLCVYVHDVCTGPADRT